MKKSLVLAASILLAAPMIATAGPEAGDKSFTVSGTGSSDESFDGNSFGVSGELGFYQTEQLMWGVRQSINGAAGENVKNLWNGSTRGFIDYHFLDGQWRPYVGANLGAIYGEGAKNSGTAGLEAGVKYYVLDKTFIGFGAEYQFLFQDSNDLDNSYNDGAFYYTLGVGFNF